MIEAKESSKFVQQKRFLLVKRMSEEVSFKASFEGRERRALTESERKIIPALCGRRRKKKARPPCSSNRECLVTIQKAISKRAQM